MLMNRLTISARNTPPNGLSARIFGPLDQTKRPPLGVNMLGIITA
jgi:hypothetical protein